MIKMNFMTKKDDYCSLLSPDLPMAGTSDHVDVWLMLEDIPSWKAKVIEDNQLSEPTARWLDACIKELTARGLRVRPQFIRQPEFDRSTTKLIVATSAGSWEFEGQGYDYLHSLQAYDLIDNPSEHAKPIRQANYFVCMNGQRDICCARFGRPVYTALREQLGDRVWQVSHLGGHRFAPNVLCLPQGGMYGRVQPDSVAEFIRLVEASSLDFEHLRGQSWYAKPIQAAEIFLQEQGLILDQVIDDERATTVHFLRSNRANECVEVSTRQADQAVMALASCKDEAPKPVYPFERI